MCGLILKLSHLNIIRQVFLVLIAVPVCLRKGLTVFLSDVSICTQTCDIEPSTNKLAALSTKLTFQLDKQRQLGRMTSGHLVEQIPVVVNLAAHGPRSITNK